MNWEALGVIGLFTIGLGVLFFIPAWIWVKRQQQVAPAYQKIILTRTGWALSVVLVTVLIGGTSMQYLAPRSSFGELVGTGVGRLVFYVTVATIFWLIEAALRARGISLIRKNGSLPQSRPKESNGS